MDEQCKDLSNILESTLSSEIISFPSGQRVENISTVTEISDFEFDSKKPSSSEAETSLSQATSNIMSNKLSDPVVCASKMEGFSEPVNDLLPQVRNALEANANMLSDKTILNDLLQSETETHANNLLKIQKKFNSVMSHYLKDDGQSKDIKDDVGIRADNSIKTSSVSKPASSVAFLSTSSTPKKSEIGYRSVPSTTKMVHPLLDLNHREPKHVNFMSDEKKVQSKENFTQKTENGVSDKFSIPTSATSLFHQHSFTSYGPEIVFEKLGEIRSHLEMKEIEEGEEHLADLPLGRLLLEKLSSQKQRTKDLEEELILNEASLTKATCELEVTQKRLQRREEQLQEASAKITQLQREWRAIQLRLVASVDAHRTQNESLKKEMDALRRQRASLQDEVKALRNDSKELADLKVKAESMKWQADLSSKQSQEILQENQRLNEAFKEQEKRLTHLQKEEVPQLMQERGKLLQENESLHTKLDTLTLAKNALEEDLKQLKERHSVLLQKAIDEAMLKEEALRQRGTLSEAVDQMKSEGKALQEQLHRHYQCQLETILLKKTSELKAEFEEKLTKAQTEFEAEKRSLRTTHESEKEEIHRRAAATLEDARRDLEEEKSRREAEWCQIRRENAFLRAQREAVVAAISSGRGPGPPPRSLDAKVIPRQHVEIDVPDKLEPPPSGPSRGGICLPLKPYQMAPNPPSEMNEIAIPATAAVRKNSKGPSLAVPPFITSTSLSSLSSIGSSSSGSSDGVPTVRERIAAPGGRSKRRASQSEADRKPPSNRAKMGASGVRRFNGRRVMTAAQILGSCAASSSSSSKRGASDSAFLLHEVDREMTGLVREINSMSSIAAPAEEGKDETPRHDTSIELDSARLALKKIDKVSDMLASAWQGLNERGEKPG